LTSLLVSLSGGQHQSGPPELEDSDIKYNPKTDYIGEGSYGVVYKGKKEFMGEFNFFRHVQGEEGCY
jgi:hypothetical protein